VRNDASPSALFFVVWLIVGSFTLMNLFVGTVCDMFVKVKGEASGAALISDEQQQWASSMRAAYTNPTPEPPPLPPRNLFRNLAFRLVMSQDFDIGMTSIIIGNVLLMALSYHGIDDDPAAHRLYSGATLAFTYTYYIECALKLAGLGPKGYLASAWNQFDFFLVCSSLLEQFAEDFLMSILPLPPMILRMLRIARVFRILRLLKRFKTLRGLLMTMVLSFPAFANVGSLLGLACFVYAVLGVQLFYFVMPGEALDGTRNFRTFSAALLLLFQCLTGDEWSALMRDASVGPADGCDPHATPSDCGSPPISIAFFTSFMLLCSMVLLNVILAVILEHFSTFANSNPDVVSASDVNDFAGLWAQRWAESWVHALATTPRADRPPMAGMITIYQLAELLTIAPPPLGLNMRVPLTAEETHAATDTATVDAADIDTGPDEPLPCSLAEALAVCRSLPLDWEQHRGFIDLLMAVDALSRRSLPMAGVLIPRRLDDPDLPTNCVRRKLAGFAIARVARGAIARQQSKSLRAAITITRVARGAIARQQSKSRILDLRHHPSDTYTHGATLVRARSVAELKGKL
jgi:hypothetical protein